MEYHSIINFLLLLSCPPLEAVQKRKVYVKLKSP